MYRGTVHGDQYAEMSLVVYSKTDNGYTVTTGNVIQLQEPIYLGKSWNR